VGKSRTAGRSTALSINDLSLYIFSFLTSEYTLPLGVIGAKTVVSQPVLHFVFRRSLDWFRGVPSLVWALILVSAFGLGPFGGVIALALADIPSLAKLFSEAIENADEKPLDGVRAAGVSPLMALRYGLAPQVVPVMASQVLFFLESNFRNAAVLGIVGAGGIGFELEERIRIFAFDQVVFITSAYGLGETVVQGQVNPDEFYVYKRGLKEGKSAILRRGLGSKALRMIFTENRQAGKSVQTIDVPEAERRKFSISD
jgi:ABC-type methionine transport system permease subunit